MFEVQELTGYIKGNAETDIFVCKTYQITQQSSQVPKPEKESV